MGPSIEKDFIEKTIQNVKDKLTEENVHKL